MSRKVKDHEKVIIDKDELRKQLSERLKDILDASILKALILVMMICKVYLVSKSHEYRDR